MDIFKYLGRTLERSDKDCPEVRWNIRKARYIWRCLGKLLRQEREDRILWGFFIVFYITCSAPLRVINMSPHVFDGEEIQGGAYRVLVIGYKEEIKPEAG